MRRGRSTGHDGDTRSSHIVSGAGSMQRLHALLLFVKTSSGHPYRAKVARMVQVVQVVKVRSKPNRAGSYTPRCVSGARQ